MEKVLVTGGAGFIGSNVVRLLSKANYDIIVLDNLTTGFSENLRGIKGVQFIKGDIRDTEVLEKIVENSRIKTVYHLAARVGNIKSVESPREDSEVNVLGTLNLLEAIKRHNINKMVHSSSAAIFGELQYLPINESHPAEPDSPYGVSKLAAEKHCLCYSRLYDIDIVCLRYFNVYGINQRYDAYGNVIPIWANNLVSGKPLIIYGDGEQTRDFINVEDVALANVMAGEAKGLRGVINIGSGNSISINELAQVFRDISENNNMEIIYEPPRKGEVKHSRADISKAQIALGFTPSVNIKKGIVTYIEWVKREFHAR